MLLVNLSLYRMFIDFTDPWDKDRLVTYTDSTKHNPNIILNKLIIYVMSFQIQNGGWVNSFNLLKVILFRLHAFYLSRIFYNKKK